MTPGTLSRENRARWEAIMTPGTLSRENRARWTAGKGHLVHFCGNTVPGGRQEETPGTLSQENRGRWEAKMTPGTLSREYCARWTARKGHLERFRGNSVSGGRRDGTPGTLLQKFRGRWTARGATWNTFAGKPWQVDGKRCYLEHFCRKTVAGGRQRKTLGTLSQRFRARWTAGGDTCHAFAGIPCQVDGRRRHLPRFRRDSVPGGQQDETPGTLSQENRGRWAAGRDTWNAFAGIPCQVGTHRYMSAGTYCGTPPVLPAMRAPSLLGSRCRLRPLYVPVISHDVGLMFSLMRSRYD